MAQLVECLPSKQKAPDLVSCTACGLVVHVCNLSVEEVEAGG